MIEHKIESFFKFNTSPVSYDTGEVFFVSLDPFLSNTDELLKSLYYLLRLPGYFGFNWNALNDCLNDFHWVNNYKIVIQHDSLPNVPDDDLKIYLEILRDSVISWVNDERHELEVVFSEKDRSKINDIIIGRGRFQ